MNGIENTNGKNFKIPWLFLSLGFIFVINPNVSIIDPLPDFFGYIIISIALNKLSLLSETMADAKKAFERMILIDGGKTLAFVWIFSIDSAGERASSMLLWSFVFSVLEAIFLIPSYLKLFKGLSDLGDYHPNTAIHGSKKGKYSYTDIMKVFTVCFIVFKAVMTVLPEFADLSNASYDETSVFVNIYQYIGIMRFLACIPVLTIGIIWLLNIIKYFKRIANDSELNASLVNKYKTDVLPRKGMFIVRNIKTACWLLVLASVLTLDLRIDGNNIIPDLLVLVALIPSFMFISRTTEKIKRSEYTAFVIYGIMSLGSYLLNYIYLETYTYNTMDKNLAAFILYMIWVISVAAKGVSFVSLLSMLIKRINSVIEDHTGYVFGKEINTDGEKRRIDDIHKELKKSFSLVMNIAIVYVISDVVYALYGAIYAFIRHNAGYLSLVNIAVGILFIGVIVRATDTLREAVKTKYMFE